MKKRTLILKICALANAVVVTAAFVGCPARKDSGIITNPIAPPQGPPLVPPPIMTPPLVTIAPYGGNFQHMLPEETPTPSGQDSKNDKRNR